METVRAGSALAAGLAMSDLAVGELWLRYFALTGRHSKKDLWSYLSGGAEWVSLEHDIAAQALNEYFMERGMDHPVTYAREL